MPDSRRRSSRAHDAVLAAAGELVRDTPYAKLTVEAIAARAGVGKQTIYRWWPSKGAVILDAMLAASSGPDGVVIPDSGDVRADMRALLRGSVAELTDPHHEAFLRAMFVEIQQDPELGAEFRERLLLPQRAAVAERLRAGIRAGQLRETADAETAVDLLLGPLQSRWSLGLPLDDGHADVVLDAALAYLATGPRSATEP